VKPILRRSVSPALVISLLALFVSLGGVSYGLATGSIDSGAIRDNTIRSRDIRNNTIRSIDLRNNEIRGRDIRNSTITGRKVALKTLTGDDINESTLGKVPSAANADNADNAASAASAANAATVGRLTVRKFFAKPAPGTPATEISRGTLSSSGRAARRPGTPSCSSTASPGLPRRAWRSSAMARWTPPSTAATRRSAPDQTSA
jgi:hypothetical protein